MAPFRPKYTNLLAMFHDSVERFADRPLLGTRSDGGWTWTSYRALSELADHVRSGLSQLGVGAGDRVAIISANRVEWASTCFACYGLGAALVPMYEAQQPREWKYILADCQAKVCVVANEKIAQAMAGLRGELPALEHVVRMGGAESDEGSFAQLVARGRTRSVPAAHPGDDVIAHFIYTSGTTGNPKGVLLSHRNIASNLSAVLDVIPFGEVDRSVAFLPWAHCFGLVVELLGLTCIGASMALCEHVEKLPKDLESVRPSVLIAVPRVFHKLYETVQTTLAEKPTAVRTLVRKAIDSRRKRKKGERPTLGEAACDVIAERLVFAKVRARFGGRLKYVVSGGSALSHAVAEFIDLLGITVFEGYGMTETSPIITANTPLARRLGSVGRPVPGVEVTIDTAVGEEPGVGEIVVRGPNVMAGYHALPEETAKVLDAEGRLRTGDLGRFDEDGFLYVTGRLKEQYKLENGKYVAPAAVEEQLSLSPYISQVMVHGANRPYNVAIVVPERAALSHWAQAHGIAATDGELTAHPQVRQLLAAELDEQSKALRPFDRVRKFVIASEEFSTANDQLTQSLKIKRRNVLKRYGEELDRLYRER